VIEGLTEIVPRDAEDAARLFRDASARRATAATRACQLSLARYRSSICSRAVCGRLYAAGNSASSRSHAVFEIRVVQERQNHDHGPIVATLRLVDLAGSEQAEATGMHAERRIEGKEINASLLALSQVISALAKNNVGSLLRCVCAWLGRWLTRVRVCFVRFAAARELPRQRADARAAILSERRLPRGCACHRGSGCCFPQEDAEYPEVLWLSSWDLWVSR
jgi:hypothetical protein